ncbi:MAG: hypothetical protein MRZ79_07570 [Bacteroidia bacterium]|nr:hypothetical protein [Bacteroidia bacterium]
MTGLLYFLKREMEFSGKLVEKKIHRVILVLTVAYFSIILGVICYEPFASLSRMSYRTTTLAILLPIEILLIVLYRALFLKQRFHIIPNREEIKEYLSIFDGWYNKEDNPHQTLIESLIESLSKDEKDEVLNQLFTHFKTHNPRKMEKIILLRNRLNFLQKQIQDGIVSFEEIKKESSLITAAILDIIKSIR